MNETLAVLMLVGTLLALCNVARLSGSKSAGSWLYGYSAPGQAMLAVSYAMFAAVLGGTDFSPQWLEQALAAVCMGCFAFGLFLEAQAKKKRVLPNSSLQRSALSARR